jgi:hypothetical protein
LKLSKNIALVGDISTVLTVVRQLPGMDSTQLDQQSTMGSLAQMELGGLVL